MKKAIICLYQNYIFFLPTLFEFVIYLIGNNLFPKNTAMNLKGRDANMTMASSVIKTLLQRFLEDGLLKVGLITVFMGSQRILTGRFKNY